MTEYTDQERETLRSAAFGAMYLVSHADPGFFASLKESLAGSKALTSSSPELREVFKSGGMPRLPTGSAAELEAGVLTALHRSTVILAAKDPGELASFRTAVTNACDQIAAASGGVRDTEAVVIAKVKAALGPATPDAAP